MKFYFIIYLYKKHKQILKKMSKTVDVDKKVDMLFKRKACCLHVLK